VQFPGSSFIARRRALDQVVDEYIHWIIGSASLRRLSLYQSSQYLIRQKGSKSLVFSTRR